MSNFGNRSPSFDDIKWAMVQLIVKLSVLYIIMRKDELAQQVNRKAGGLPQYKMAVMLPLCLTTKQIKFQ